MGGDKQRELPADLRRAQKRFQGWQRTKKPKSRIPEPLWELAVELVAAHGLQRTARVLKLDYYALKERVEAVPARREETRANGSTFLELPSVLAINRRRDVRRDAMGRRIDHWRGTYRK